MKNFFTSYIVISMFIVSCVEKEDFYLQFKTYKFERNKNYIKKFSIRKIRLEYDQVNDSTIKISINDPIKNRSTGFRSLNYQPYSHPFIINKNTKLLLDHGKIDTLGYESQKKYKNLSIFSFYYHSKALDSDYRLFFSNSFGAIAFYSGPWSNLTILDKIIGSEELNAKWQRLRIDFTADSLFFPTPIESLKNFPPPKQK